MAQPMAKMVSKNMRSKLAVFVLSLARSVLALEILNLYGGWLVDRSKEVREGRKNRRIRCPQGENRPEALVLVLLGSGQGGLVHKPLDLEGPDTLNGHVGVVVSGIEGISVLGMAEGQQRRDDPDGPADHRSGS